MGDAGTRLASGDTDGDIYVWNLITRTIAVPLSDPDTSGVEAVAFSPDGTTLAVGDADHSAYLWNDADHSAYLWNLAAHARPVRLHVPQETYGVCAVAFSPSGALLATGDHNGSTYLWHLANSSA